MVNFRFSQILIALSSVALTVSGAASPFPLSNFKRTEVGWPQGIADEVLNSSSPNFDTDISRWSTFEAPTFDSVFLPKSEGDLSIGLHYLTSNNISFLVKSGGHGYSSTLEVVQNAVMISMENFNYTIINDDFTATVGSGMTFNNMVQIVAGAGRELTVGSCPCVGAIGAMLGGGVGRLQGLRGLTSDAVTSIRMVLWNGTIIEVSDTSNSDLYWGMRGAGQNFGVVIEATFKTFPATNNGVNYQADLSFTLDNVGSLIDAINSLFPLPAPLSLVLVGSIDPTSLQAVPALNLIYAGTEDEGRKYSQLFTNFSASLDETNITFAELPNLAGGGFNQENCINGQGQIIYTGTMKTLDKASFIDFYNDFGSFVQDNPSANESAFIIETFGQQGVNALPNDYDAFPHRGQIDNLLQLNVRYFDDSIIAAGDTFAKKWRDHFAEPVISGYPTEIVYQNYAHGDEPLSYLYGLEEWRHVRLTSLKNSYDPHGFFDAYHGIPRTLAGWA